jgi:hypothetical protein
VSSCRAGRPGTGDRIALKRHDVELLAETDHHGAGVRWILPQRPACMTGTELRAQRFVKRGACPQYPRWLSRLSPTRHRQLRAMERNPPAHHEPTDERRGATGCGEYREASGTVSARRGLRWLHPRQALGGWRGRAVRRPLLRRAVKGAMPPSVGQPPPTDEIILVAGGARRYVPQSFLLFASSRASS